MVVLGQPRCIRANCCIRAKMVVFGQKWLYFDKVVVFFGQKSLYSGKDVVFGQKWL